MKRPLFTLILFISYLVHNSIYGQSVPNNYQELESKFKKQIKDHNDQTIDIYKHSKNKDKFWLVSTFSLKDTSEYRAEFITKYAILFRKYIEYDAHNPITKKRNLSVLDTIKEKKRIEVCQSIYSIYQVVERLSSSRHPKKILSFRYLKEQYFDTITNPTMLLLTKVINACHCDEEKPEVIKIIALHSSSPLKSDFLQKYNDSNEANILQPYSKLINAQIKLLGNSYKNLEEFESSAKKYKQEYKIPTQKDALGYKAIDKFVTLYYLEQFFHNYIVNNDAPANAYFEKAFKDLQTVFENQHPAYQAKRNDYEKIGLTLKFITALKDSLSGEVRIPSTEKEKILPIISFPQYRDTTVIRLPKNLEENRQYEKTLNSIKNTTWKNLSKLMTIYRDSSFYKFNNRLNSIDKEIGKLKADLAAINTLPAFIDLINFYVEYLKEEKVNCGFILNFAKNYLKYTTEDGGLKRYEALFSPREVKDIFEAVIKEGGYCFEDNDIEREKEKLIQDLTKIEKNEAKTLEVEIPKLSDTQISAELEIIAEKWQVFNKHDLFMALYYKKQPNLSIDDNFSYTPDTNNKYFQLISSRTGLKITGSLLDNGDIRVNVIDTDGNSSEVFNPISRTTESRSQSYKEENKREIIVSEKEGGVSKIINNDPIKGINEISDNRGVVNLIQGMCENSVERKKIFPNLGLGIMKCTDDNYHCHYCTYKGKKSYLITLLEDSVNINDIGKVFTFEPGEFVINDEEVKNSYQKALSNLNTFVKILIDKVGTNNFTLCFQGEADISGNKTFNKELKEMYLYYLDVRVDTINTTIPNKWKQEFIYLKNGEDRIKKEIAKYSKPYYHYWNRHLPDLRAIYFKEYIFQTLIGVGNKKYTREDLQRKEVFKVVKGRVTKRTSGKDMNCVIVLCIDWDKANEDLCNKNPNLCSDKKD